MKGDPYLSKLDFGTQMMLAMVVGEGAEWLSVVQRERDKEAQTAWAQRAMAFYGLWFMFLLLASIIITSIVLEKKVDAADGMLLVFVYMLSQAIRKTPRP